MIISEVLSTRPRWRERTDPTKRIELSLILGSVAVAIGVAVVGLLLFMGIPAFGLPRHRMVDILAAALLVGLTPYGVWWAIERSRRAKIEARFPDLLRDLAASRKAGLTLPRALASARRGNYGALNPQISIMQQQLAIGVRFEETLRLLAERAKSPLITRAVAVINEAVLLGGNVNEVLAGAARDAREIKASQQERRLSMLLYTLIIYIAFLVFLGVVVVLYLSLIPALVSAGAAAGSTGPLAGGGQTIEDYRTFFFLAAIVQGVGNGIVAGAIGAGKAQAGLLHAAVMCALALLSFAFI